MNDNTHIKTKIYGSDEYIQFVPKTLNIRDFDKGIYKIFYSRETGYYFSKINDHFYLPPPEKIYSNDDEFINHVLKTVNHEKINDINIILEGKKGLGKSFTGKILANKISSTYNCPIIVLDNNNKDVYNVLEFLNKLTSRFVLFIDEFEKIFPENVNYDGDKIEGETDYQSLFLSFLDGSSNIKNNKVVIATSNSRLSSFFYNRPSRFRYVRKYNNMSEELIEEIINKNLNNKEFAKDLLKNLYKTCNIDVLEQIINEINLFDKPYSTFKSFFNHTNEKGITVNYEAIINVEGLNIKIPFKCSDYLSEDTSSCSIILGDEFIPQLTSYVENIIKNNSGLFYKVFGKDLSEKDNDDKFFIDPNAYFIEYDEGDETATLRLVLREATNYRSSYFYIYNFQINHIIGVSTPMTF